MPIYVGVIIIHLISITAQLAAAIIAWSAIRLSGKYRHAWACISVALLLMIERRVEPLLITTSTGTYSLINAIVGLVISLLMVAGVWGARLIFFDLQKNAEELARLATIDELTGLANRRYVIDKLDQEIRRAMRSSQALALVMFDIDQFKSINDSFGHAAGDAMLRAIGQLCLSDFRQGIDIVGRWGGEEFLIVLPELKWTRAIQVAERLRSKIENLRVPYESSELRVTISVGVTSMQSIHGDPESIFEMLMRQVDSSLYGAKQAGRNCVVAWTPDDA